MVLENELKDTLCDNSWDGMWQLQALSTAWGMSILSVYPEKYQRIRHIFNRIISPLLPFDTPLDVIPILWSGYIDSSGTFKPNNFVPLVPENWIQDPFVSSTIMPLQHQLSIEVSAQKSNRQSNPTYSFFRTSAFT